MSAGRRNHKITIESKTLSIDDVGESVETWATYSQPWSEITAQTGREFVNAREQHAGLSQIFTIRFDAGINHTMRINRGGQYYNIIAAFDPSGRRHQTKIYCNDL